MSEEYLEEVHGIPDGDIVEVLILVLEARSRLPDTATLKTVSERLSALATEPQPLSIVDAGSDHTASIPAQPTTTTTTTTDASSGVALARTALSYLVGADIEARRILPHARRLANQPDGPATRLDPTSLLIGGLVLAVLQTEVVWTRNASGKWKLQVHKKAMRDSTIAALIRGIFTASIPPGGGVEQSGSEHRPDQC